MTKKVHTPIRTCIISRQKLPQKSLLRFVINPQKIEPFILLDSDFTLPGRGIYIAREKNVIGSFLNTKKLSYLFKLPKDISLNSTIEYLKQQLEAIG